MKKITLILIGLCFITLQNCSKSIDESPDPVQAELKGTWRNIEYTFDGRVATLFHEDYEFYDYTGNGWELDINMVFNENPQTYSLVGNYYVDNTALTDDGDYYEWPTYHSVDDGGPWSIVGNIIHLNINGENNTAGITLLTQDTLIINISSTESVVASDNITTTTTTKNETYIFERISN